MKLEEIKAGDVLLVHGVSVLADLIEVGQEVQDKANGKWTHAAIFITQDKVAEADKLGICITRLRTYTDAKKELAILRYKEVDLSMYQVLFYNNALYYSGRTRYNKVGLLQQTWKFFKMIFNKDAEIHPKNTDKRFMCASYVAKNIYEATNNNVFKDYTAIAPIDLVDCRLFDFHTLEY